MLGLNLLAFVGLVLLGAAVVAVGVFAAAWQIGKALNEIDRHPSGCGCIKCQAKRLKELERAKKWEQLDKKPPSSGKWISTVDLMAMVNAGQRVRVMGKGSAQVFAVKAIITRKGRIIVILRNELTGNESWVPVPEENLEHPIWLLHFYRRAE